MEGEMEGEDYDDSDSEDEVHDTPFMRPGHCHGSNHSLQLQKVKAGEHVLCTGLSRPQRPK
jgi:hypothetical protein